MMHLEYRMTTGRATTKLDPSQKDTATGSRCGRLSEEDQEMYAYNIRSHFRGIFDGCERRYVVEKIESDKYKYGYIYKFQLEESGALNSLIFTAER